MNDSELLKRYAESGCETSFAELVQRNVGLVFSAALRQVNGDRHLAEEVTQTVFTDLARKAKSLSARTVLSGWLYTSTRFIAAKRIRTERRRSAREIEAVTMHERTSDPDEAPDWAKIEVVLDEAMHQLGERDRNAVLLRYFQGQTYDQVGATLGVSPDGARMRVERALEKLRKQMASKGVASTAAGLAVVLTQQSIAAAPVGLAATVTGSALASAAVGAGASFAIFEILTMTKLKAGMVALALAGVSVPLVMQHQANNKLVNQNKSLVEQREQLTQEIEPLKGENGRLKTLLAERTQPVTASNELYRLRDEVTRLRAEVQAKRAQTTAVNPLNETLQSLATRAANLKQTLEQMPEKGIPEMRFLSEKDWLNAVGDARSLESEEDYREALNNLRGRAKSKFGEKMRAALKKYAEANNGQIPENIISLQSYLDEPVDAGLLERYKINRTGSLSEIGKEHDLIVEVAPPVDDEYDSRFSFGVNGTSSKTFNQTGDLIRTAATAFAEAHQGLLPKQAAQLAQYLPEPLPPGRIQKYLDKIPADVTTLEQMKKR